MTVHFLLFNSCFCRFGSHLVCRSLGKELCIFSYLCKISCCQEEAAKIVPCIFFWEKNVILQIGAYDIAMKHFSKYSYMSFIPYKIRHLVCHGVFKISMQNKIKQNLILNQPSNTCERTRTLSMKLYRLNQGRKCIICRCVDHSLSEQKEVHINCNTKSNEYLKYNFCMIAFCLSPDLFMIQ